MQKDLSQEEIDSMVRAARGAAAESGKGDPNVQPWDARQSGQIGREQMRSISQLHEIFARNLTHSIGAFLRIVFDCSLVSAEHVTYRDYLQTMPENAYLATCRILPVNVVAAMQLDLAIAFPVIDLLLGGEGKGGDLGRAITEIEEQVLESVLRIICRELQSTWQAMAPTFEFGQRQPVSQARRLMSPDEKNLCLSFEVKMPETRGTLNMAVPAVVSNALLRKISSEFSYRKPTGAQENRLKIQEKLLDCPFPVELSVPQLQLPLQTLADMKPGTLLSFSRSASTPAVLVVDEVQLGSAAAVRVGSRRAARVVAVKARSSPAGEP